MNSGRGARTGAHEPIQSTSRGDESLRRLVPLTPVQKARLVIEILRVYAPLRLRLRHDNLKALAALARRDRQIGDRLSPEPSTQLALRLGRAVARTLRLLPTDSRCLIRSLVLLQLLARRGIEASLVIGFRKGDEQFAAHAWIEYRGVALLPSGGDRFARLLEM